MQYKNPSQYFDNIEMFIKAHPDHAPLAMLMTAVRSNGCPENLIDAVVNGMIAQELNLTITPQEQNVSVYKDGRFFDTWTEYNPTYEGLINDVVNRFTDLPVERAKGIVDTLLSKQAIKVYPDGKIYRTMVLLPRQLLTL
jgi:hypothetical protein